MSSAVYQLSDRYIEQQAALDPGTATYLGIAGHDHEMTDFSPAGHEARAELDRATLKELGSLDTSSDSDRLAAGVLRESLELGVQEHAAGEHLRSIRVIAGDVDAARAIFDLMPTSTAEQWSTIAERMSAVPKAFAGMRESWALGVARNVVAPQRQALAVAAQLEAWSGSKDAPGFFTSFVEQAASISGAPLEKLRDEARRASVELAETAKFLRSEYAPQADPRDGVGPERHALARRRYLGMSIEAQDAYEWGWQETKRLDAEIARVSNEIKPGTTASEVRHLLDTDPARAVHGEENLRAWLQELMDEARDFLISNKHFDIPREIHTCEAMISPPVVPPRCTTQARVRISRARGARGTPLTVAACFRSGVSRQLRTTRACRGITSRSQQPRSTPRSCRASNAIRSFPGMVRAGRSMQSG